MAGHDPLPLTLVLGDPMPSSGNGEHWNTDMHAGKIPTHTQKKKSQKQMFKSSDPLFPISGFKVFACPCISN